MLKLLPGKKKNRFIRAGRLYNHVITVCDETSAEQCPFFPGITTRLHWSFADPSGFSGTYEEKLDHIARPATGSPEINQARFARIWGIPVLIL
ncbi:MAG: hypothetical protein HY879_11825 [Deltaproteobacteria bacterium]|nr:hypothetical protein [Deltaproteobacteria bacterium]